MGILHIIGNSWRHCKPQPTNLNQQNNYAKKKNDTPKTTYLEKIEKKWRTQKWKVIIISSIVVAIAFTITVRLEHGVKEWLLHFSFHLFVDLGVALCVYLLLEDGFEFLTKFTKVDERKTSDIIEIIQNRKRTKKKIIIYDTFISNLLCFRKDNFVVNHTNLSPFLSVIKDALHDEVEVQILLLHPNSNAAKQRAKDLINTGENVDIIAEMELGLRELFNFRRRLSSKEKNHLYIKLFDSTPIFSLLAMDNLSYLSFFNIKRSQDEENFIIPLDSKFGSYILVQYENIWSKSKIKLEDYMQSLMPNAKVVIEGSEVFLNNIKLYFSGDDEYPFDIKYLTYKADGELNQFFAEHLNKWITIKFEGKQRQLKPISELKVGNPGYKGAISLINSRYGWDEKTSREILNPSPNIYYVNNDNEKHVFSATVDNINEKFKEKYFYFIKGSNINCGISNYSTWEQLCRQWDNLVEDTEFTKQAASQKDIGEGNFGLRKRRIVHFKYDHDNDDLKFHPTNNSFIQHRDYSNGNKVDIRYFELLEKDYFDNILLHDIIKFDFDNMLSIEEREKVIQYGTLHFIRIEASKDKRGIPSIEKFHQDHHKHLAFHLIRRKNVSNDGALTVLRDIITKEPLTDGIKLLDHLDTLYISDEKLEHFTSDFESKDGSFAYRDMLLIDFDETNKYEAW